jgi:1-acyl-sn-glycerol-3-phosphate acyltransferase
MSDKRKRPVQVEPTVPSPDDVALRDPDYVAQWIPVMKSVVKRWFRSHVEDIEKVPAGGALVVSNHSGGVLPMDVPIFATDLFATFGTERPFYVLAHDVIFIGPLAEPLKRGGIIPATRENAHAALLHGGIVVVFPGGDYDACRPTMEANKIDFRGRVGYVRTAVQAGVPIVPLVSIGGQETQLYLSRGQWLAKRIGLNKVIRSDILPISFGLPFGVTALLPVNLPLPSKIVSRVLEPIDVVAQFGPDPDPREVDEHIRAVMQQGLDDLARQRRFPLLG